MPEEENYQVEQQEPLKVRWVYVGGLLIWVLIWALIFWCLPKQLFFVSQDYKGTLFVPVALGAFVLICNLLLWWRPGQYTDYATEVSIIEFVERNASWFLIASGAFLTAAAFFLTRGQEEPLPGLLPVLIFEGVSVLFLLFPVTLYWIPPTPKHLARLRHIKTVPFTFGVSFFAAALASLLLSVALEVSKPKLTPSKATGEIFSPHPPAK